VRRLALAELEVASLTLNRPSIQLSGAVRKLRENENIQMITDPKGLLLEKHPLDLLRLQSQTKGFGSCVIRPV